jgi:large subunit ribosomal protein L13
MRTHFAKKEDFRPETRRWYHVDAEGKVLGRLATRIAVLLMGKDRPDYTPHVDTGAYVVVTNAEKVRLTGKKLTEKMYQRYSGYPGGLRERSAKEMLEKHPEEVIWLAVRRMLPRNRLGREMLKKLKVYRGPDHPHTYAKPQRIDQSGWEPLRTPGRDGTKG